MMEINIVLQFMYFSWGKYNYNIYICMVLKFVLSRTFAQKRFLPSFGQELNRDHVLDAGFPR